jgi:ferric-dicitrate binding protein FerR (iron transport regulator)
VRVGGREDAATFHVRTPVGIAEARGSDFAVWYRKEKIVVCSAAGRIALTDLGGRELVTLEKYEPGMVNIAGIPALDVKQKAEWLHRMLTLIKKLNGKSAALVAEKEKGIVLSDLEQRWLKSLHPITYYVKARLVKAGK